MSKEDDHPVACRACGLEIFWAEALEEGLHNIHQSNGLDGYSRMTPWGSHPPWWLLSEVQPESWTSKWDLRQLDA